MTKSELPSATFFSSSSSPTNWALDKAVTYQNQKRYCAAICMVQVSTLSFIPSALKNVVALVIKIAVALFALTLGQIPPIKKRIWLPLQARCLVSTHAGTTLLDLGVHVYKVVMFLTFSPLCCVLVGTFSAKACKTALDFLRITQKKSENSNNDQQPVKNQEKLEDQKQEPKKGPVVVEPNKNSEDGKEDQINNDQIKDDQNKNNHDEKENIQGVPVTPIVNPPQENAVLNAHEGKEIIETQKEPQSEQPKQEKTVDASEASDASKVDVLGRSLVKKVSDTLKRMTGIPIPPPPAPPPPGPNAPPVDSSPSSKLKKKEKITHLLDKFDQVKLRKTAIDNPQDKQPNKEESAIIFNQRVLDRARQRTINQMPIESYWTPDDDRLTTEIVSRNNTKTKEDKKADDDKKPEVKRPRRKEPEKLNTLQTKVKNDLEKAQMEEANAELRNSLKRTRKVVADTFKGDEAEKAKKELEESEFAIRQAKKTRELNEKRAREAGIFDPPKPKVEQEEKTEEKNIEIKATQETENNEDPQEEGDFEKNPRLEDLLEEIDEKSETLGIEEDREERKQIETDKEGGEENKKIELKKEIVTSESENEGEIDEDSDGDDEGSVENKELNPTEQNSLGKKETENVQESNVKKKRGKKRPLTAEEKAKRNKLKREREKEKKRQAKLNLQ